MISPAKSLAVAFSIALVLGFSVLLEANAQEDNLILKVEQHWETFGIGGACIPGQHNLAIADVDGDGSPEIITGGFSYDVVNGTETNMAAPLKIWRWDGVKLTLEANLKWPGGIWCVYAADADGDGEIEIMTAGTSINGSQSNADVKFWNWDGKDLKLRKSYDGIPVNSIWVGDIDKDGKPEITMVGRPANITGATAQLSLWRWNGVDLALLKSVEWSGDLNARANSVFAADLEGDGETEIVTGGYNSNLKNSSGQIRVWQWDGSNLVLKANAEWQMVENTYAVDVAGNPMGNTVVNNVKVADVDGDNVNEILTGGFTYDGDKVDGQLRIWNWNGSLNLKSTREWSDYDITELKSIAVNDLNGDGTAEIVTSGVTAGKGGFSENATTKEWAQLKIWNLNRSAIVLKHSESWIIGDGVCAWQDGTSDLDKDGKVEIVTVGCMYSGNLCDPDLRIWNLPSATKGLASTLTFYETTTAIVVVAIVVTLVLILRGKRRRKQP